MAPSRHGRSRAARSAALAAHVRSPLYLGGMVDHSGGHLHPLNLALGEAAALESLGGAVHERTRVVRIENEEGAASGGAGTPVRGPRAQRRRRPGRRHRARAAPLPHADPRRQRLPRAGRPGAGRPRDARLHPSHGDGAAVPADTRPRDPAEQRLRRGRALHPRLLPAHARSRACRRHGEPGPSRSGRTGTGASTGGGSAVDGADSSARRYRLLFGGGTVYGGTDPKDVEAKLRPADGKGVPGARGHRASPTPGAATSRCRSRASPSSGRLGPETYYAMGYSGHGVTGSHLFGRLLAEAVERTGDRTLRALRGAALDSVSRAGSAFGHPTPRSARGGTRCATGSASERTRRAFGRGTLMARSVADGR